VQGSVDNAVWNDLVAGGSFATNAANSVVELALDVANIVTSAGRCRYARIVDTVTTGPVLMSSTVTGIKKVTG